MMKNRALAMLLSMVMIVCLMMPSVLAEENVIRHSLAELYDFDSLTVGTSTAFTGNFMNSLFGNNGVDLDVRELIHAHSPVQWVNDAGTYEIDPAVVSNLIVSDDENGNRTFRIFLYSDLYYSDGTRITAADYVFSVLLSVSDEVAAIGGVNPDLSYIMGMDAYLAGEADTISGLRLLSENAFAITVNADALPNFYELSLLDFKPFPSYVIAPGCVAADQGNGAFLRDGEVPFSAEMLQKTLLDPVTGYVSHPSVMSGAYVLTSYDGETCEFELNPCYKGDAEGRKPAISRLTYKTIPTDQIVEALETGEIGLINKLSTMEAIDDALALVGGGTYRMSSYPRSGGSFISFSCERIAMSDENVRKAIAWSFDKNTAVASYVGDMGIRVDGYYGAGQWMLIKMLQGAAEGSADEEAVQEGADALSMDAIPVYNPDARAAAVLLDESGWNLDLNGRKYAAGNNSVRCKAFDRQQLEADGLLEAALQQGGIEMDLNGSAVVLIPLQLRMYYPEGNTIADCLQETLVQPLSAVGIRLDVQPVPYQQLLQMYYRNEERDCDMIYLATNFMTNFDLTCTFSTEEAYQKLYNTSGILDEELYQAARDLIRTEPGDTDTYCQKWLTFQILYQEKVPGIFVYSNVYLDVYTYALNDYDINNNITWSHAILNAYMGDPLGE